MATFYATTYPVMGHRDFERYRQQQERFRESPPNVSPLTREEYDVAVACLNEKYKDITPIEYERHCQYVDEYGLLWWRFTCSKIPPARRSPRKRMRE